jgi:hypothetical protein
MKNIILIILLLSFGNNYCNNLISNDSIKSQNPILFAEMVIAYSNGDVKGLSGIGSLNYQYRNNLFSFRGLEIIDDKKVGNFLIFPFLVQEEKINEYAILYGRRFIYDNHSLSYSLGVAYIDREYLVDDLNTVSNYYNLNYAEESFVGLPFELNVKWFNSKKERYRIYELIPVGRQVGFANSIGFKFYGAIAKKSYIGIGISFGLGWHKTY